MEPFPPDPSGLALRRREALLASAGGAIALGLAACGSDDTATATEEAAQSDTPEVRALIDILQLERRAVDTYDEGIRFSRGEAQRTFAHLSEQALAHVRALEPLIIAAGGPRPGRTPAPNPAFVRDADSAVRASRSISNRAIRRYLDAIELSPEPARRGGLMTMLANTAEHLVVLGGLSASSALPGGVGA